MSEIILVPSKRTMLVPLQKCMGANFTTHKHKYVRYKGLDFMMVEWTVEACREISRLGLQIKSPIYVDYKWSGGYVPFEHQAETADFMVRNLRGFTFNDIGTGKTLSSLWAADFLITRGDVTKVLVCSTLSTLDRVWSAELFQHFPHRSGVVLHGTPDKRRKLLAEDHNFYIINHEGLKLLQEDLLARPDINLIICDEGARFRNSKTALWKALHSLANPETGRYIWWMTGSPMPRAPTDAWAQAKIVNPTAVPRYFNRFREQTMVKINQFKWVAARGWEDIAYSSLKPSIRFARDECIDLPECMYVDHNVGMSKAQAKAYESLKTECIAELQEGLVTAANEGVMLMKLVQVACGAIYNDKGEVSKLDCKPKLDELNSIVDEVGTKVIVFVPFKHSIKILSEWADKLPHKPSYGIVNGAVAKGERDRVFKEFQSGDLDFIFAHPAAMAHGLTLTASNTIVWWGPLDNFEIYEQANGRITRPGQKRLQYIKHLISSPVEVAVYSRLKKKESMQGILLDMIKN